MKVVMVMMIFVVMKPTSLPYESGDGNDDFRYYEAYITSVCRELSPQEEVNEVDLENIFAGKV